MHPDHSKGMEVHPDADYAGAWEPAGAGEDIDMVRSRHGYIVSYCGAPLFGKSQMQTEIALSSTEAEFIALATATRAAIPIQHILTEMKELGFPVVTYNNSIHCHVFEDNSGVLAIAKVPKTSPRTKRIHVKYFHLRILEMHFCYHVILLALVLRFIFLVQFLCEPMQQQHRTLMGDSYSVSTMDITTTTAANNPHSGHSLILTEDPVSSKQAGPSLADKISLKTKSASTMEADANHRSTLDGVDDEADDAKVKAQASIIG
jgi:hypothetical protein